jgi:ornithine carbamoyltransferase
MSLVDRALMITHADHGNKPTLTGKIVGIYFRCSSTRTRTAFSAGAIKLGATVISYGPRDLQLATGETVQDTARVLANYLDALQSIDDGHLNNTASMNCRAMQTPSTQPAGGRWAFRNQILSGSEVCTLQSHDRLDASRLEVSQNSLPA